MYNFNKYFFNPNPKPETHTELGVFRNLLFDHGQTNNMYYNEFLLDGSTVPPDEPEHTDLSAQEMAERVSVDDQPETVDLARSSSVQTEYPSSRFGGDELSTSHFGLARQQSAGTEFSQETPPTLEQSTQAANDDRLLDTQLPDISFDDHVGNSLKQRQLSAKLGYEQVLRLLHDANGLIYSHRLDEQRQAYLIIVKLRHASVRNPKVMTPDMRESIRLLSRHARTMWKSNPDWGAVQKPVAKPKKRKSRRKR